MVFSAAFIFIFSLAVCSAFIYIYIQADRKKRFAIGIDINKENRPEVPESCGIAALFALLALFALFSFLSAIRADAGNLGWLMLITVFALVGFADDRRHKFAGGALRWPLRAAPIAAASFIFSFFLFGEVVSALLGALFIAGAASFHNSFAGLNGWEVGSSFIISAFVSFLLYGSPYFLPSIILSSAMLAMLLFNRYPAKVFPGDSGTLLFGSAISGLVLLGGGIGLAVAVAAFYLPHAFDFFVLKLLTNPSDVSQSSAKPYSLKAGRITIPHYTGRTRYDLAKLIVRIFGPLEEWKIVALIWIAVFLNCLLWTLAFQAF
jgi:UDP-N-acetylglucosamine--dolichyl-phosphate N-acetylglucosaminephosphotransferase